jgi:hypothetical protein
LSGRLAGYKRHLDLRLLAEHRRFIVARYDDRVVRGERAVVF